MKKILLFLLLCSGLVSSGQCVEPMSLTVTSISATSATLSWTDQSTATSWDILVVPDGSPPPTQTTSGWIAAATNPFVISGLSCGAMYSFYIRAVCTENTTSWAGPVNFSTMNCGSNLPPIQQCDTDGDGIEMFDITMYEMEYLSQLPPGDYTFSYHLSEVDAQTEMNPLPFMFPSVIGVQNIFVRAENNATGEYELFTLTTILNASPQVDDLPAIQVCDANGDGFASFNIFQNSAYIYNTYNVTPNTWSVNYYETMADAQAQVNPLWNLEVYNNIQAFNQYLYVGIVDNMTGCMTIEPLLLQAMECTGISMTAFLDLDNDGIRDSGEPLFPYGEFTYQVNEGETHYVQSPGEFAVYDAVTSNTYDIGYSVAANYAANYTVAPASYENIAITGSGMQQFYFAVSASQIVNDVAVTLIPNQAPRPGFTYTNTIVYTNLGTTPASGTVTFTNDTNVTITNISQAGTVNTSTGFTYGYTNLLPFQTQTIVVTMQVPTIPTVQIGDQLVNSVSITMSGAETSLANNDMTLSQTIVGSYDPNDKTEAHGGKIVFDEFTAEDYLEYTIRFENTGTAEAINIRIEDVLDASLDASTVQMVKASHFYSMERNGNELIWNFNNVMLPPTMEDPIGSHGYITFRVKPLAGFEVGDIIPNTASIFFDFNPAIITNTFETEFVNALSLEEFGSSAFRMYPNPAQTFVTVSSHELIGSVAIYSPMGTLLNQYSVNSNETAFDVSTLTTGVYIVKIFGSGSTVTKKLIVR